MRSITSLAVGIVAWVGFFVNNAQGQLTQEKLRSLTQDAVADLDSVKKIPLILEVRDKTFRHNLNSLFRRVTDDPSVGLDSFPLQAQLIVESVRRVASTPDQKQFWAPYLGKVEKIVAQQLDDIATNKDPKDQLVKRLEQRQREVKTIMLDAVAKYASRENLKLAGTYAGPVENMVRVKTIPENGSLLVLPYLTLQVWRENHPNRPDIECRGWQSLRDSETADLFCKIAYQISWTDKPATKTKVKKVLPADKYPDRVVPFD